MDPKNTQQGLLHCPWQQSKQKDLKPVSYKEFYFILSNAYSEVYCWKSGIGYLPLMLAKNTFSAWNCKSNTTIHNETTCQGTWDFNSRNKW